MSPCFPVYHTAATLRAWKIWRRAHPLWTAKAVVPACVRAAALSLPLALPSAAFLPPAPHGGVQFSGPAYAPYADGFGSVFVPGVYQVALPATAMVSGTQRADRLSAEVVGSLPAAAVGGSPTLTPMTSGDVPHWLPDRDVPGQSVPPVDVPEPSSVAVLCAALAFLVLRGRVR